MSWGVKRKVVRSPMSLSTPVCRNFVDPGLPGGPETHGADRASGADRGGHLSWVFSLQRGAQTVCCGAFSRFGDSTAAETTDRRLEVRMMLTGSKMPCFREGADSVLGGLQDRPSGSVALGCVLGGRFGWLSGVSGVCIKGWKSAWVRDS